MGIGPCKPVQVIDITIENHIKIENEIRLAKIESSKTIKILLLGSSDSGKSTIVKQMRILHQQDFTESEMTNYRFIVFKNLIQSFHYVTNGIYELGILIPHEEEELINKFHLNHFEMIEMDDIYQIANLQQIKDYECVKNLLGRRTEVYLPDNTAFFFKELDRILKFEYRPTILDVLHTRIATSGVHEISFGFKEINIRLIDVGGQKTERRKWIHCFENVVAVLFVVALSSYDQFMIEDPKKNCLRDSLELFKNMYQNRFLLKSSFILFLNKKDLFEEKLSYSPLNKCFSTYTGSNDNGSASEYINKRFLKTQHDQTKRRIYSHFSIATDTKNIELMFNAACDIIIQTNLSSGSY